MYSKEECINKYIVDSLKMNQSIHINKYKDTIYVKKIIDDCIEILMSKQINEDIKTKVIIHAISGTDFIRKDICIYVNSNKIQVNREKINKLELKQCLTREIQNENFIIIKRSNEDENLCNSS